MKISYFGYFTPFGGYGIANLAWVKYLKRLKVDVSVNAKFVPLPGTDEYKVLTPEERRMFKRPYKKQRIGIIETTPFNFNLLDTDIKIANTMAETDKIGPEWVLACNLMDQIIVPNEFYKKVFKQCGVEKPIEVIPHGVNTELYKFYARPKREYFTFGSCGYLNNRKGAIEIIRAFASEFDIEEPVKLRLHTTDPDLGWYKNQTDPRIEITDELWPFNKLNEFYQSLDCFVFPSRAEGIGYPPREAMATGCPAILMNYSGLEEIADLGYKLKPDGFERVNPMREQPGRWATINISELMYWMRYAYEHKLESYNMGIAASKEISNRFNWSTCASKLVNLLTKYDKN